MRVYYVYEDVWRPMIGDKCVAEREFNNPADKHAMQVMTGNKTVGHVPHQFSRIGCYFLSHGGEISVEVIGQSILYV